MKCLIFVSFYSNHHRKIIVIEEILFKVAGWSFLYIHFLSAGTYGNGSRNSNTKRPLFTQLNTTSTVGDNISNVEDVQYFGGCLVRLGITSVLWRMFSTVGDDVSTMEDDQYCRGCSVL